MIGKFIKVRGKLLEVLDKVSVKETIHKYENGEHSRHGFNYGDHQNIQAVIGVTKYLCRDIETGKTVTIDPDDIIEVHDKVPDTVTIEQKLCESTLEKVIEEIDFASAIETLKNKQEKQ